MSFFVQPTDAPMPKTKNIRPISLFVVALLVLMAVAQLFTFERFPDVIMEMWLPGEAPTAAVLAAMLPTLEILALPFLLSMRLSPAMRVVSMVAGWFVGVLWLVLLVWQNTTSNVIANNGLLGDTLELPVGWWSVFFAVGVGVLLAWISWGMWPFERTVRK